MKMGDLKEKADLYMGKEVHIYSMCFVTFQDLLFLSDL